MRVSGFGGWLAAIVAVALLLAGCSSTSVTRAPVEDRAIAGTPAATVDVAALPGAENAGKPGYYTVRPGDTIMRIATEVNQPWRDIARWNNLDNANAIEVGQVLRVVPPTGAGTAPAAPKAPVPVATQTTPGSVTPAPAPVPPPAPAASAAQPPSSAQPAPPSVQPAPPPPSAGSDDVKFIWPAQGSVVGRFDGDTNKGIGISGKAGDPVVAAADGKVIYAGAGLPAYGNLIILKHNNTFLTAYAHNKTLLVKEDQTVKKGQKIAEMGSSASDRVKLHFEIRRSGTAVDPMRYLPPR